MPRFPSVALLSDASGLKEQHHKKYGDRSHGRGACLNSKLLSREEVTLPREGADVDKSGAQLAAKSLTTGV
jgi:hypothetical protein